MQLELEVLRIRLGSRPLHVLVDRTGLKLCARVNG